MSWAICTLSSAAPSIRLNALSTPDSSHTAPKILWVRKNEPKIYGKTKHILLPKDYIRYRMTGEYATEVSDASGTLLLDVAKRAWSGKILSLLDIDPALLPRVYESTEITGAPWLATASANSGSPTLTTPTCCGSGAALAGCVIPASAPALPRAAEPSAA